MAALTGGVDLSLRMTESIGAQSVMNVVGRDLTHHLPPRLYHEAEDAFAEEQLKQIGDLSAIARL
jgi:hypothetical protein